MGWVNTYKGNLTGSLVFHINEIYIAHSVDNVEACNPWTAVYTLVIQSIIISDYSIPQFENYIMWLFSDKGVKFMNDCRKSSWLKYEYHYTK